MSVATTIFCFISLIPYGISIFRTCIPNTQFQMNGRVCYCDALGQWSEANCETVRRQSCQPGQIIWEDCRQCICQEDGSLNCINTSCNEDKILRDKAEELNIAELSCLPFLSYYINCSLCVCPATGKMSEARCAKDSSCSFEGATDLLDVVKKDCIPKVMYLFPCLQCQCSDDGLFVMEKCVKHCRKPQVPVATKCIPNAFYRKDCNVCWCPNDGIADDSRCSKDKCDRQFKVQSLNKLKSMPIDCYPNTFTDHKCLYCECNQDAKVNKSSCLKSDCITIQDSKYGLEKDKCSPGEVVAYCTECLCVLNGMTDPRYCTNVCSDQQKLIMLEQAITESLNKQNIIDVKTIQKVPSSGTCEPNSIYFEGGKYCLCPDKGITQFKLCTAYKNETDGNKVPKYRIGPHKDTDFTAPCDPSTFVEFECNTCYCQKFGRIDPNWCTYDDCKAKAIIQTSHRSVTEYAKDKENCVPGSILSQDCNFCICPASGQIREKICTTNNCTGVKYSRAGEKFSCDPLAYYNVDCNTCYCPANGIKNLAKCTKSVCGKSFLRSDECLPGDLFSVGCNVCVCPPNGDKSDRVCTENVCLDAATPWNKIFKLSQSLLSNQAMEDTARSLELCFPGEEFAVGCKVCVCPDMGLRIYASCTNMLCGDERQKDDRNFLEQLYSPA